MKINIQVVKYKEKLLFKYRNLLFDFLEAYADFYNDKLKVLRKNKVFDTAKIGEIGTHAPSMCFYGLSKLTGQYVNFSLASELFLENDLLVIEVKNFNKEQFSELLEHWTSSLQRTKVARK